MNWIILIIAGLCETAFAFCLGKLNFMLDNYDNHENTNNLRFTIRLN